MNQESIGFPSVAPTCPACADFMTDCGEPQPDMFGAFPCKDAIPLCGTSTPLVSLEDFICSPGNCYKKGCDDQILGIILAVSEKINDYYGERVDPCYGTRCFQVHRCKVEIDSAIRVERVEISKCSCDECIMDWTPLNPCDVVLVSKDNGGLPPYTSLKLCNCCACPGTMVRVTGVWGLFWPIPQSIRAVIAGVTNKVYKAMTEGNRVISNLSDGVTTFVGASFSLDEFSLLPRRPLRYRGRRV